MERALGSVANVWDFKLYQWYEWDVRESQVRAPWLWEQQRVRACADNKRDVTWDQHPRLVRLWEREDSFLGQDLNNVTWDTTRVWCVY